jgi:hypothetical protein
VRGALLELGEQLGRRRAHDGVDALHLWQERLERQQEERWAGG